MVRPMANMNLTPHSLTPIRINYHVRFGVILVGE
jgi:hypothetical protein